MYELYLEIKSKYTALNYFAKLNSNLSLAIYQNKVQESFATEKTFSYQNLLY